MIWGYPYFRKSRFHGDSMGVLLRSHGILQHGTCGTCGTHRSPSGLKTFVCDKTACVEKNQNVIQQLCWYSKPDCENIDVAGLQCHRATHDHPRHIRHWIKALPANDRKPFTIVMGSAGFFPLIHLLQLAAHVTVCNI